MIDHADTDTAKADYLMVINNHIFNRLDKKTIRKRKVD